MSQTYTAFEGEKLLAHGPLERVVLKVKKRIGSAPNASVLVFSDSTGKEMDFDLRGSEKEVLKRLQTFLSPKATPSSGGPGRPKLGVVAREVSLLPKHWEWLSTQSGGASATIRRLVENASKAHSSKDLIKQAQERTYKFLNSIAGNSPNFEEALRMLYRKDKKGFFEAISTWPTDIKGHAKKLSEDSF